MSSWDVVTTVKADRIQIDCYIAYYLGRGAGRIYLFLDDPAAEFTARDPRVSCIRADPATLATRPAAIEQRQLANASHAARISQAEWILQCDIDEYLDGDDEIASVLKQIAPEVQALLALPVEPVYRHPPGSFAEVMGADIFKRIQPKAERNRFWANNLGDLFLYSSRGFWAHRRGKVLSRTALARSGQALPLHSYHRGGFPDVHEIVSDRLLLRHYDALSYRDWLAKHRSRVEKTVLAPQAGPKRDRLSRLIYDTAAQSDEAAQLLFRRMFVLGPQRIRRGLKIGALIQRPPVQVPGADQQGSAALSAQGKGSEEPA